MTKLDLSIARRVIVAAEKHAEKIGVPMNVAVVDEGGNLVAFERMAGAWLGSIEIAQNKAYTARAFDITTKELGAMSQPKEPLFGIANTNQGRVITFGGGAPIKVGDTIIGAVGVSGGKPDQDHEVAMAALAAIG